MFSIIKRSFKKLKDCTQLIKTSKQLVQGND